MLKWFKPKVCVLCSEKDKQIDYLQKQNKELLDRFMAYSKEALYNYKKESGELPPLYPFSVDDKGNIISEEATDIKQAKEEIFRAFAEDPITVEEPNGK